VIGKIFLVIFKKREDPAFLDKIRKDDDKSG